MSTKTLCSMLILVLITLSGALAACGGQNNTVEIRIVVHDDAGLSGWGVGLRTVDSGKDRDCGAGGVSRSCTFAIQPGLEYMLYAICGFGGDDHTFTGDISRYFTVDVFPDAANPGVCGSVAIK
jgi:hypothetical protein